MKNVNEMFIESIVIGVKIAIGIFVLMCVVELIKGIL